MDLTGLFLKFCGNTLSFSLFLLVARMGEKFCVSLSDLYARWGQSDGGGVCGAVLRVVQPGAEPVQAQTVKLDHNSDCQIRP